MKLSGLPLVTVLPIREQGNNYSYSEGSESRVDSRRPGDGYLHGNQYGFTLGFPIQLPKAFNSKNRLFFVSNFESLRNRSTLLQSANVPTLAMIPASRPDPYALKLFQYYPR